MSYEKVKNISKRKDGRIFITSASNNVWPKYYERYEYMPESKHNKEKCENRALYLFRDIIGYCYQFNNSVNENWKYALNKFEEYCGENNISVDYLWDLPRENGDYDITKLKPYYDKFNEFYEEKIEGKYFLYSEAGVVSKVNKNSINVIPSPFASFGNSKDYKTIYNRFKNINKETRDRLKIEIIKMPLEYDIDVKSNDLTNIEGKEM